MYIFQIVSFCFTYVTITSIWSCVWGQSCWWSFFKNSSVYQDSTVALPSRRVAPSHIHLVPPLLRPWPLPASMTNTRSFGKAGASPASCPHCCTTLSPLPHQRPTFTTFCAAVAAMTTVMAVIQTSQRGSGRARQSTQRARRRTGAKPATRKRTGR